MSRLPGAATLVAIVVLSWLTVSCSGPIFFKPPVAAAPVVAAAPPPAEAWSGLPVFLCFGLAAAMAFGAANFIQAQLPKQS
jgi:hypothetical protein